MPNQNIYDEKIDKVKGISTGSKDTLESNDAGLGADLASSFGYECGFYKIIK